MSHFPGVILVNGGDLVSTRVTKLKVHAEDVTILVKNVTNLIVAKKYSNDAVYAADAALAA